MNETLNPCNSGNKARLAHEIISSPQFTELLINVPLMLIIINQDREVIYANKLLEDHMMQGLKTDKYENKKPGDCLGCLHALSAMEGCGTTKFCEFCGLADAIRKSETENRAAGECRIELHDGNALVYKVYGYGFKHENHPFLLIALENISDQKARRLLENIFLHDLNNSLSILLNLPEIFDEIDIEVSRKILSEISLRINDEIKSYQIISAAENQQLMIRPEEVNLSKLMSQLIDSFKISQKFSKKSAELNLMNDTIITDKTILRQVLYNMIKNAMEAGSQEETIKIYSRWNETRNYVIISVQNSQVMPYASQMQVFKKSFSTKDVNRGWGTYSIKLLTEKYLKGKASFRSNESEGTIFSIELPA